MKLILLAGSMALILAPAAGGAMPRENSPQDASPVASAAPSAPTEPAQPVAPAAAAPQGPLAPGAPNALSPAAGGAPQPISPDAADSDLPEEVGQDASAGQPVPADLGKLDTQALARLARSLGVDAPTVWYDPDQQQPVTTASDNAQSVDAAALYSALQQRSDAGDKDARQALALARLRGDARAQPAPASGTAEALGLSPSAAASLGLQALSAAAQALGLSPSAGATPAP